MPYEITIKKVTERSTVKRGAHTVIDKRPWTPKELDDKAFWQSRETFLKETPLKEIYGYAPDVETTESVETEVLKQTVEDMDLAAVIRAVNKL